MKNTVVVYESRYGSTKRYATWIAEELGCALLEAKNTTVDTLDAFGTIIYGGWLHACNIKGFKLISQNIDKLTNKKIIVFSVGCASGKSDELKSIEDINFKNLDNIKHFYLRGAFNYQNLNMVDKILMDMMKMKLKRIKEEERDDDAKGLLDAYINPIDFTDKDNIKPLISYSRRIQVRQ
ncbi:flavodoxin domain-containing protein [Paraclostridium ghonii]|uniref:Menaquinone-dependent protoporphyrinogen IX oxidase n=1 Tax=Paraclostridium ghonii TaxID=29358 RepID=A0ABU0MY91_9FIRM|nr:flavodoxin domain-containing protein [Paeniclostridium ghonii]MDQ0555865.1 menaquinone-dependent protoporphyrinogen IX oxidase [Paeniclostridium ghonii]